MKYIANAMLPLFDMWMQGDIGFGLHDRAGYNLYFKTLHLPVGQMYTEDDMQYIVDVMEERV